MTTPPIPDSNSIQARPQVRSWPAQLILALAAGTLGYVRFAADLSHQWQNIYSMEIGIVTVALLLLWVLFLSRLRWKIRLLVFAGAIGFLGLLASMVRIQGVSGDLVPILKFRWSHPAPSTAALATEGPPKPPASIAPVATTALTNSFPQFMGPHRNATLPDGPKLSRDWTAQPPQLLWRQPIGAAWSGFAVVGNRAVTQEQQGNDELVVAYELLTGKVLWTHADAARYFTTIAGEGPRTTPAITGEKVVTVGSAGLLNCLDLATGKSVWSKNIITENHGRVPDWGVAGSPLILDNLVIVNPGGADGHSLVAYRLSDGEFVWSGGDDEASYSSPFATTLGGVPQVLIFNQHAIFGHDAATGRILWRHPWDASQPHVALPVELGDDRVLFSSGYGVGSESLKITRDNAGQFTAQRLWKSNRLKAKFNNLVVHDGYVYGLDDGILACLDLASGELKWKDGRYGHGQSILVRDVLLITAEDGEVVLVDPVPTERRELTRFRALNGKTWNPPALVGDLLLVRNDQEVACYRLPVAK